MTSKMKKMKRQMTFNHSKTKRLDRNTSLPATLDDSNETDELTAKMPTSETTSFGNNSLLIDSIPHFFNSWARSATPYSFLFHFPSFCFNVWTWARCKFNVPMFTDVILNFFRSVFCHDRPMTDAENRESTAFGIGDRRNTLIIKIFVSARLFVNMVGGVSRLPYMMPDEENENVANAFKGRLL